MKRILLSGLVVALGWCSLEMTLLKFSTEEYSSEPMNGYEEEEEEEFSGADRQMTSWWWSKAFPNNTNLNQRFYSAWLHAEAMRGKGQISRTERSNLFAGNWVAIGPDQNIGGRILSIAVNPSNNNIVFAGSASGGLWKSTTGGSGSSAWQHVETGFPVLGVASIVIHPTTPNTMFIGTGEVYRADTSNIGFNIWKGRGTYGVGVLKSTDGGNTWSQVLNSNFSDLFGIQMLEFDPSNSNTVYACATDGLYRSTDLGDNWNKILDKIYVSDVAIHPTNPNQIVVGVGNLQNSDKGIYRTTNGGGSWTKISSGLPSSFEGFIRLDNVAASPNMIIASIGRSSSTTVNELYQSNDFGASWSVLPNSNHCEYQFWFAHDVAINPSSTTQLMMAGVPLYRYNTSTGTETSIGGVHADIHDIEYDPTNSAIVYVACDGGVYKSTNSGSSFSMINGGLQAVQFYASFAVHPTNSNIMLGGLQDNGIVRYNGSSWSSVAGGDGGPCAFHPTSPTIALGSNDARRVLRSTTTGSGFSTEVLSSWAFNADSRTGFMAPIAIAPSDPTIMYVASDNLHKSTSSGSSGTWTNNSYSTANDYIEGIHKTGVALAVSHANANKVYVSTSSFAQYDNNINNLHINTPPNVFRSVNGGSSFTNIKGSLPDRFIMDFAISKTNDDSVWIVLGGFGTSHVYVSGNGGSSWTARGGGLPDVPTNAILIDPSNPQVIYVGNDLGVYVSPDLGATWHDYNNGLWDATQIADLVAAPNGDIVAATHGKGVFVSDPYLFLLPVKLVSFSGTSRGDMNYLQWVTNSEVNASHYEIERSYDGIGFVRVGTVAATNLSDGWTYNFNDKITTFTNTEALYYRLKMVDKTGEFSYSNVVKIKMEIRSDLVIKQNPFNHELRFVFTSPGAHKTEAILYDISGRKVLHRTFFVQTGSNEIVIGNLWGLPKGTYVLDLYSGVRRYSEKVVKITGESGQPGSSVVPGAGGGR